jgi:hypothetical protein
LLLPVFPWKPSTEKKPLLERRKNSNKESLTEPHKRSRELKNSRLPKRSLLTYKPLKLMPRS